MGYFEQIISLKGSLQGKERSNRRLLFVTGLAGVGSAVLILVTVPSLWPQRVIQAATLFAGTLHLVFYGVCGLGFTQRSVNTTIGFTAATLLLADMQTRSINTPPSWPFFVLLTDLALVLGLSNQVTTGLIALLVLWLMLVAAESVWRFGMFDLPGSAPEWYRLERFRSECSCDSPPCAEAAGQAAYEVVNSVIVLVVDFIATRGFADAAEKEKAAMAHTIETVEAIAQLLAGYDVDTVADMLQEAEAEGRLPAAMHEALQRLEQNLRAYRPYLPEALFEQLHRDDECHQSPYFSAPGSMSEEVALVFTDVRALTSIWEAAPEAMNKAMQTHNTVIREIIKKLGGYEVKTIGDAFMVAFEEACTAVDFGLAVQQQLLDAQWPAALLEVPICRRTDLWGGLTVRIGVNHGPVTLETNALTGRVDYFGHTVNVASRLEGVCPPGAVAVPADLWAQVSAACLPAAASAQEMEGLKGVSEAVSVHYIWPTTLRSRQHHPLKGGDSSTIASSNASTSPPASPLRVVSMREKDGTIGTVSLCTVGSYFPAACISESLEAVMPLLQQSRGTLITLLGEHVFVGWNLVHAVPVHAENAVSFAQRVLRSPSGSDVTMGLASGTVQHGDVGTSTQRFVSAAGRTVDASLQVWRAARDADVRCLYTTADADRPLGALQAALRRANASHHTTGPLSRIHELAL